MSGKNQMRKEWEGDSAYRRYVSSHHPEAIEFIKRNAKTIKSKGEIWLDVQTYSEFSDKAPDGSDLPGTGKVILFKKIIFDIFPRKIKPQYIKEDTDYNRYITWKTATEDIQKQKAAGNKGERWIVECLLEVNKTQAQSKKVLVPEARKRIENPAYSAYLKSQAYQKYKVEYAAYESRLREYKAYRRNFQEFILPDGTVKRVLLYMRAEEKYEMLRSLGVPEVEIQASRQMLVKPDEPSLPPAPSREITKVIPSHYEDRMIPGKWVWNHSIKSVRRA